jgi:hypothetical protein
MIDESEVIDYKALVEQTQAELDQLAAETKERERLAIAHEVIQELGMPALFVDRLVGDTREELLNDALSLCSNLGYKPKGAASFAPTWQRLGLTRQEYAKLRQM